MKRALAVAFLVAGTPAMAQDMSGMKMGNEADAGNAQIVVTINPEARVSAVAGKALPIRACGSTVMLQVKIVNQGSVRAPLRTKLVDTPENVVLHESNVPLSGRPEELQMLHITSARKEETDLTFAFSFTNDRGDLAYRDQVHLLLRCLGGQ